MAWWVWVLIVVGLLVIYFIWSSISFSRGMRKMKRQMEEIERAGGVEAWQANIQEQIKRSDEILKRNDEILRRNEGMIARNEGTVEKNDGILQTNDQWIARNDQSIKDLKEIQAFLRRSVYTEGEAIEITKLAQECEALLFENSKLIQAVSQAVLVHTNLMEDLTHVFSRGQIDTEEERIDELNEKIEKQDKEIDKLYQLATEQRTPINAYDIKFAHWLEIGRNR